MNRRSIALYLAILGLLFLFSCGPGHYEPRHPVVDPDTAAQTDPDIVFGVLPNGFQYILMENATPENRVNIHLNVFAGSLHETDEQQGVAHFLEHMLFNGSEHFEPGELIKYFPSIGMDFGADANAHTSFLNTVYDLSLPESDYKQMDEAFVIIQDYAKGALLLEAEIERERGIIFAEKRERDSVSYRTFKKSLEFELPDSLYNQRFPIGIERVIEKTDQKRLKAYYDQWYRPDNMVLIAVGDFDGKMVSQMISERFSKLKPRSLFAKQLKPVKFTKHEGIKTFYHHEPEAGSTDITIQTISWQPFEKETLDDLKKRTLAHIANTLLQNRLSRMVSKQTADFSKASISSGVFLHHIAASAIQAVCEPDKWEKGLSQIEKTLRQGLSYGFTKKELDRVKAEYISSLEQQVSQAETRKSPDLSKQILRTVNRKGLLLSIRQKKDLLAPYVESISLQDAHEALKETWSEDHRLILVTGNADIKAESPETAILDVYQKSLADKVEMHEGFESKNFPYLEPPTSTAGIRSRQDNVKDLDITTIEFNNNVQLNLKKTSYKQNEFLFKVCFGKGKKSEIVSKPGLSFISEIVLKKSGLGSIDPDQLEESLAGKKVSIKFGIDDNYFTFTGASDPEEAELVFQLIYHYFNDPGYRAEALGLTKTRYKQKYDSLMRTPSGIMQIKGNAFLAGNDPRFGLPSPETMNRYSLDDIKNWLLPYFQNASVEMSIVGDFDMDNMIHLASKYMGSMENRKKFADERVNPGNIVFPKGEALELKIDTKVDTGVVHVAFLTDDFWDIMQTRRLSILSKVFSERLSDVIREDLGETYSPYVYNDSSMIFDDYGVLHAVVNVKSENHLFVYDKIKEIIVSLSSGGISEQETKLALNPVLNHLKVLRKTNRYWLNSVLADSSEYPQKLDWAKSLTDDYAAITHDDLILLAKKYLNMDESAHVFIKPEN